MGQLTTAEAGADLVDRADVEALLRRFYGRALHDEVLAEPFAELRATGLETHVPTMCDFWETVLFRAGLYRGNALRPTGRSTGGPRCRTGTSGAGSPFGTTPLTICIAGPAADRAKVQAGRIAWAMHRRLTGADAPELLLTQPARDGRVPDRTGNDDR